uniref:Uncharacterized protein n=1 Tax=Ailuropoda melanoleuca TaxID=9646 RepID=A0A7N5KCU4_AILME
ALGSCESCLGILEIWLVELIYHGLYLESNTQYYPSVTRTAQYLVLDLRTYQLKSQHAPCLQLLNSTVNLKFVSN